MHPSRMEQSSFHPPDDRERATGISQCKFGIYIMLLVFVMSLPIAQLLIGSHYRLTDKTHASHFLISNAITYFYGLALAFCKVSKACGCQKSVHFFIGVSILPISSTFIIGVLVFLDLRHLQHGYVEDYGYCNPMVFYLAYISNIFNLFIGTGYVIITILNYLGFGITTTQNERPSIYCCGETITF